MARRSPSRPVASKAVTKSAAAVLATALAAALVLAQPWLGRWRYRQLLVAVADDPRARMRHYRRGIIGEWAGVAIVGLVGLLAGRGPASIGIRPGPNPGVAMITVIEVAAVLGASALVFRYGGPTIRDVLRRQARGFEALLPHGVDERVTFALLSVTAGICEEVLFRGFGIAYLHWLWPDASKTAVIAITAACFGLVHLYQGARGVVLTGLVGAYLAWLVVTTGSLWPAIAIHALLDLRILALPDLSSPTGNAGTAATSYTGSRP